MSSTSALLDVFDNKRRELLAVNISKTRRSVREEGTCALVCVWACVWACVRAGRRGVRRKQLAEQGQPPRAAEGTSSLKGQAGSPGRRRQAKRRCPGQALQGPE